MNNELPLFLAGAAAIVLGLMAMLGYGAAKLRGRLCGYLALIGTAGGTASILYDPSALAYASSYLQLDALIHWRALFVPVALLGAAGFYRELSSRHNLTLLSSLYWAALFSLLVLLSIGMLDNRLYSLSERAVSFSLLAVFVPLLTYSSLRSLWSGVTSERLTAALLLAGPLLFTAAALTELIPFGLLLFAACLQVTLLRSIRAASAQSEQRRYLHKLRKEEDDFWRDRPLNAREYYIQSTLKEKLKLDLLRMKPPVRPWRRKRPLPLQNTSPTNPWDDVVLQMKARFGVQIELDHSIPELDPVRRRVIAAALQEGLNNGVRHGGGQRFRFQLYSTEEGLEFRLLNDGMEPPSEQLQLGAGLALLEEQVLLLGGKLQLVPADPEDGSSVSGMPWRCKLAISLPAIG